MDQPPSHRGAPEITISIVESGGVFDTEFGAGASKQRGIVFGDDTGL